MAKAINAAQAAINTIAPHNAPAIDPATVNGGAKPDNASRANDMAVTSAALESKATNVLLQAVATGISDRAKADAARLSAMARIDAAVGEYFATVEAQQANEKAGYEAAVAIDNSTAAISRELADTVMAGIMSRKEARAYMGKRFGFKESEKTGKATSTPLEPGNSIAKRVSSLAICHEYVTTGTLPDKGGDSLALVPVNALETVITDYERGAITVRAASEQIERLIRDNRENIPLEMNPDKIRALSGKIATARDAIAKCPSLFAAYAELALEIAAIPFPDTAN